MVSLSSVEKDSIATTRDSFKDCILACQIIEIKCAQSSTKEKFHKQSVVILLKNGCSIRLTFCTIFVPLYVKVLEKHVRSSLYLVLVYFKENSQSHEKFTEPLFLLQLLYTKCFEPIFFENLSTKMKNWR